MGEWKIPNNVVCRDDTLTFYAVDPAEAPYLARSLRQFCLRLPRDIAQTGSYTRADPLPLSRSALGELGAMPVK